MWLTNIINVTDYNVTQRLPHLRVTKQDSKTYNSTLEQPIQASGKQKQITLLQKSRTQGLTKAKGDQRFHKETPS